MATKVTRTKRVAKGRVSKAAKAAASDQRLLAQAAEEDGEGMNELRIRCAVQMLRLGCDQLGQAIAGARQADDFETVDNLTPVLASIWSARMELGDGPEVQS